MKKLLLMAAALTLLTVAGCQCPWMNKESADSIAAKMQKAVDVSGKQKNITSAVIIYNSHLGKEKLSKVILKLKEKGKIKLIIRRKNSIMMKAFDGKTGWMYTTGKGLRFLNSKELEDLKFSAIYLAPNIKFDKIFADVKLDGSEKAAGIDCWKLICTPDAKFHSEPVVMLVDKKTYLVVKTIEKVNMKKKDFTVDTYFGDYEELDGIMTPLMMVSQMGKKILESKLISVQWNAPIDDSEFTMPKILNNAK